MEVTALVEEGVCALPGLLADACNPRTQKVEWPTSFTTKFQASLGYRMRPPPSPTSLKNQSNKQTKGNSILVVMSTTMKIQRIGGVENRLSFKILFLISSLCVCVCVCVSVCEYMHVSSDARGVWERVL